jgi:vacuolar-type H+-ATPase subunit I/STV1
MRTIVLIIGTILCSILYRLGGAGKTGDWLIPPIMLTCLALNTHFHLIYIFVYLLVWGLMGGALSTYWDWLFGYDNMYAHGFFVGLSTIPCMFLGIHLYSIVIYTIALSLSMGLVSHKTKLNAVNKERIRGALIIVLLPILLT